MTQTNDIPEPPAQTDDIAAQNLAAQIDDTSARHTQTLVERTPTGGDDQAAGEVARAEQIELARREQWHWIHACLGHAGQNVTDAAMRSGRFGQPTTTPRPRSKFCRVCAQAKGTANALSSTPRPRHERPGVVFHADLSFPKLDTGRDGGTCFCVFFRSNGFIVLFVQQQPKRWKA